MEANTLTKNIIGINYELNEQDKTATVRTLGKGEKYEGNIVIPAVVTYKEPYRVEKIASWVFEECSGLTSITIPDSVTRIGYCAFSSCSGLTSIIIPNSVTEIEDRAFNGCTSLISVTIPNSVTSIGDGSSISDYGHPQTIYVPHGQIDKFCELGLKEWRDKMVEI